MGGSHPHDSPLHTVPLMGIFPTTGERYGNFSARMKPKRPGVAPGAFRRSSWVFVQGLSPETWSDSGPTET